MINIHDLRRSSNPTEFQTAVLLLAGLQEIEVIEAIGQLAQESDGILRAGSIKAAAKALPASIELHALRFLNDDDWLVRVTAIRALERCLKLSLILKVCHDIPNPIYANCGNSNFDRTRLSAIAGPAFNYSYDNPTRSRSTRHLSFRCTGMSQRSRCCDIA